MQGCKVVKDVKWLVMFVMCRPLIRTNGLHTDTCDVRVGLPLGRTYCPGFVGKCM